MTKTYLSQNGQRRLLIWALALSTQVLSIGVTMGQSSESIPFSDARWTLSGDGTIQESYRGYDSVYLPQGGAMLQESTFSTGVVEFDFTFPEGFGFPGLLFRMQSIGNYEDIYFRPHQSGNPDAMQYAPTYDGVSSWQLFHGQGHWGQFDYPFDAWVHAKVVIADDQAEVFLDDMTTPVLFIHDLKREEKQGMLGLRGGGQVRYANFSVVEDNNPTLTGTRGETTADPAGSLPLTYFSLSSTFPEAELDGVLDIPDGASREWTGLWADASGTANFSRVTSLSETNNTVWARVSLTSEEASQKLLSFGYSDRVKVFLNGKLLYAGTTAFQTRDYRYLGSVGYYDHIGLPLIKGENELWFAVSEDQGGWGIKARIEGAGGVAMASMDE